MTSRRVKMCLWFQTSFHEHCGYAIWRAAREKGGLNPWSEEKDEREIPLTVPDAVSLGQLVSAEKWALFNERCPPVSMLFLVRKERLIAPSSHLLWEFTCCDRVSEKETQEPAWISKTSKQANKQTTTTTNQTNPTKTSHNNDKLHKQTNKQTNSITPLLPLLWSSQQGLSFLSLLSPLLTFRLFLAIEILLSFAGRINYLGFILL